jgi:hypothetical protein
VKYFLKIAISAAAMMMVSAVTFGSEPQVTICHYPPGNPANFQIITVGSSAAAEHVLNHGDNFPTAGASMQCPDCSVCPGPGL